MDIRCTPGQTPSATLPHANIADLSVLLPTAQVDALYADFGDALREDRYAQAAKEGIRANAAWLQRNAPPLCAWLGAA